MSAPSVSVIIPCFDSAATISSTVASVQAQTLADIEIVVVNDGSTDESAALVDLMAKADRRIRLITTTNQGVAAARNVGLRAARGEIIAAMDSDDLWHPLKLARQVPAFNDPDVQLSYCSRRTIDVDDRVILNNMRAQVEGWVPNRITAVNFVGNGSAICFRRTTARSIGGYNTSLAAAGLQGTDDFLIQVRLAAIGKVAADPLYLVGYRRRPNQVSSNDIRMLRSKIRALQIVAEEVPAIARTAHEQAHLIKCLLMYKTWAQGRRREAAELLGHWMREACLADIVRSLDYLQYRYRTRGSKLLLDSGRRFHEYGPDEEATDTPLPFVRRTLNRLARRDFEHARRMQFGRAG